MAQSVKDYTSSDSFTAVLYDRGRQQLYLSAGDHIDVFSLGSNQFISPLTPPALGAVKQFAGLAMTPDGSLLLATDLLDGSLAVINPDSPSSNYVIPITPAIGSGNPGCTIGPIYVGAAIDNQAFVATGGLPGIGCGPGGSVFVANLVSRDNVGLPTWTVEIVARRPHQLLPHSTGTRVYMAGCIYDVSSQTYYVEAATQGGAAFSGDGNAVAASYWFFCVMGSETNKKSKPDLILLRAYDFTTPVHPAISTSFYRSTTEWIRAACIFFHTQTPLISSM